MKLSEKIELQRARKAALAELNTYYDTQRYELLADYLAGKLTWEQMTTQYDECMLNYRAKLETIQKEP